MCIIGCFILSKLGIIGKKKSIIGLLKRIMGKKFENYRIAGNFRGRKLSLISRIFDYQRKFSPRTFRAWHA